MPMSRKLRSHLSTFEDTHQQHISHQNMLFGKCTLCNKMLVKHVVAIQRCGHTFHRVCIENILAEHRPCPRCANNQLALTPNRIIELRFEEPTEETLHMLRSHQIFQPLVERRRNALQCTVDKIRTLCKSSEKLIKELDALEEKNQAIMQKGEARYETLRQTYCQQKQMNIPSSFYKRSMSVPATPERLLYLSYANMYSHFKLERRLRTNLDEALCNCLFAYFEQMLSMTAEEKRTIIGLAFSAIAELSRTYPRFQPHFSKVIALFNEVLDDNFDEQCLMKRFCCPTAVSLIFWAKISALNSIENATANEWLLLHLLAQEANAEIIFAVMNSLNANLRLVSYDAAYRSEAFQLVDNDQQSDIALLYQNNGAVQILYKD